MTLNPKGWGEETFDQGGVVWSGRILNQDGHHTDAQGFKFSVHPSTSRTDSLHTYFYLFGRGLHKRDLPLSGQLLSHLRGNHSDKATDTNFTP